MATTLKSRLQHDLTDAMRARDDTTTGALRMALAAITVAETAGSVKVELSDDQTLAVLAAEAKKRVEAIEIYDGAGRPDKADFERGELAVFRRYLPAELSAGELAAIVADEVATAATAGLTGPKAMGAVIKAVRARTGTSADGAVIASLVKQALT